MDTETGEFVFKWPADREAELSRLRGVLGPDASVDDVGWVMGEEYLTHSHLYIGRSFQLDDRTFERRALDVFELDGIELDSVPIRRDVYAKSDTSQERLPPCSPEALFGRLSERDGELAFE